MESLQLPRASQGTASAGENNPDAQPDISTFQRFKELPLEIRRLVWIYALPGPRYVEVQTAKPSSPMDSTDEEGYASRLYLAAIEKAPALFFTCQESRTELKRFYHPFKGTNPGAEAIWVDFRTDVFCFCTLFFHSEVRRFLELLSSALLDEVAHLSIDRYIFEYQWANVEVDLPSKLPGLKDIKITYGGLIEVDDNLRIVGFHTIPNNDLIKYGSRPVSRWNMGLEKRYPEWKKPAVQHIVYIMGDGEKH